MIQTHCPDVSIKITKHSLKEQNLGSNLIKLLHTELSFREREIVKNRKEIMILHDRCKFSNITSPISYMCVVRLEQNDVFLNATGEV